VIGQFAYLPQGSTLAVLLDDERFKTGQLLSGWPGRCRACELRQRLQPRTWWVRHGLARASEGLVQPYVRLDRTAAAAEESATSMANRAELNATPGTGDDDDRGPQVQDSW